MTEEAIKEDEGAEEEFHGYVTTEQDYARYKAETEYWVDYFGLKSFEWFVEHNQTDESARAECMVNHGACMTKSTLQKLWDEPPTKFEIEKVAFHEVLEAMLSGIWVSAKERFVTEEEIDHEKHRVVRIMENTVWKDSWELRKPKDD